MRTRRIPVFLIHGLLIAGLGLALVSCDTEEPLAEEAGPPERVDCAVTVYNAGRALVKDTRSFELEAGVQEVSFDDVTSGMIPASVHVEAAGDGPGVAIHEQNFEYDLVSTQRLLQRHIGEDVGVTTASGEFHRGTLLAGGGDVILRTDTGGVVVLRSDQILDVVFADLPEGLASKPSLQWLLEAEQGGTQDLTVTYLSGGFGWQADYIVQLSDADDAVDVSGWVSVDNHSEATFADARLKLVAGDVYMQPARYAANADRAEQATRGRGAQAKAAPQQRSFFDYHLYEMPRPVTLRAHETKQVEFLDVAAVPAEVTYELLFTDRWYGSTVTHHPTVTVELTNGEEQHLGVPLPAGTVRVYKADVDGAAELVGESRIEHTPRDEKVELAVGEAFDIVGEWKQTRHHVVNWTTDEYSFEVTLRNHKTEDARITLKQQGYYWGEWKVRNASHDHTRVDNQTISFEVEVPADGETVVTYTIRTRW